MRIKVPPIKLNFIGFSSPFFCPSTAAVRPCSLIGLCFNKKSLAAKKLKLAIAGSFSKKCSSSE